MREPLPDRRAQETVTFEFRGLSYDLSIGRFPDGRLAEVFVACAKSTSPSAADARDAAILISVACQYGASPEALRNAVTRVDAFAAFFASEAASRSAFLGSPSFEVGTTSETPLTQISLKG